jgi:hypothetical protein
MLNFIYLKSTIKKFISNKNECSKFGDIDIVTGKYDYEEAIRVRNNDNKCGEDAIFFKFMSIGI